MSHLLVIEDSPSIALLLKRRLELAGHTVSVWPSGAEALEGIQTEKAPDLALTDVMMPGIDGIETARRLKERLDGLPVIIVTAKTLDPEEQLSADRVVTKPIDFDLLLNAIAELGPGSPDA